MSKGVTVSVDRLAGLLESALVGDHARAKVLGAQLVQECLDQGDEATAKRLRSFIRRRGVFLAGSAAHQPLPVDSASRLPLVDEEPWPTTPAILNSNVQGTIQRFLHDIQSAEVLAANGLLTRFGLMLSGPPGTGKTLVAGHIAARLGRPFLVARLDSLISSRLGETAKNIRQVFEFVPARGGVLFLDEIDAVAKMRDDRNELGELKRVVNTVIQGLDSLDDRGVVIGATNHPQLLDSAIWRRFPYHCAIVLPDAEVRAALWLHFLYSGDQRFEPQALVLSQLSEGFSGADIENVALAARRLSVLNSVEIPEAGLLLALSKSAPPSLEFPELKELSADDKRHVFDRLEAQTTNKSVLASMLGMSRQMVHRYLQEESRG